MTDPEKFRCNLFIDRVNELAEEMIALQDGSDADNVLAVVGANLAVIVGSVYDGSLMELSSIMNQFARRQLAKLNAN